MTDGFRQGAAWIDGRFCPISEAKIGVTDWGLTHADVAYDVVPVWEGGFFRLPDYLARFAASMASCRMDVGLRADEIETILHQMVAKSGLRHAYVSMVAARGTPLVPGTRDPRACKNHFYAWCVPYVHVVKPEIAEQGARVWLSPDIRRIPDVSVNPRAKNYHWGDFTQGLFQAKDHGFETVVLMNLDDEITEGPGFNIFALKNGKVVTPDAGVLMGITRRTVLEMAREAGFETEERALPKDEFLQADEVFLSSSGGGVIPVSYVGDRAFSNGTAGPESLRLRARYFDRMRDPDFRTSIQYDMAHATDAPPA